MTFFDRKDVGRVYVIKMVLPDGYIIYKVGMVNSSRSTDRLMEILRSWFTKFRFVPYSELRLDMECNHPLALEQHLHKILAKNQFMPNEKVDGGTEMFIDIDEFRLIRYMKNFNEDNVKNLESLTSDDYSNLNKLLVPGK